VPVPCQHNRDVLLVLGVPCQHSRNVVSALMCHVSENRDVLSTLLCHVSTRCAMSAKQRHTVSPRVTRQENRDVLSALVCHASKTETSCSARFALSAKDIRFAEWAGWVQSEEWGCRYCPECGPAETRRA
jgi:hypothetical protein